MSYRDDVEALAARHAALHAELAAKQREIDESRRLLEEARELAHKTLPPTIRWTRRADEARRADMAIVSRSQAHLIAVATLALVLTAIFAKTSQPTPPPPPAFQLPSAPPYYLEWLRPARDLRDIE